MSYYPPLILPLLFTVVFVILFIFCCHICGMSTLNKNAKEFKPIKDIIDEIIGLTGFFRLPNIIPNLLFKSSLNDVLLDKISPTISFVMPMCSGKTYYSKKFGLIDIDLTRTDDLENILKPLRKDLNWPVHNKVWFDHTVNWFKEHHNKYDFSIVFTHSVEHALALNSEYIIPIKLKQSAWSENLKERRKNLNSEEKKDFDELTIMNWNSVKGTLYESRAELELAIIFCIKLCAPKLYKETISIGKLVNYVKTTA